MVAIPRILEQENILTLFNTVSSHLITALPIAFARSTSMDGLSIAQPPTSADRKWENSEEVSEDSEEGDQGSEKDEATGEEEWKVIIAY